MYRTETDSEKRLVVAKPEEEGVGGTGSLGFIGANDSTENGRVMRSCCAARGPLSSLLG